MTSAPVALIVPTNILTAAITIALIAIGIYIFGKVSSEREDKHWMAGVARDTGGTFHKDYGDSQPTTGLTSDASPGTPLKREYSDRSIELTYRGRTLVGVDYTTGSSGGENGHNTQAPMHAVQVRGKPGPRTHIVPEYREFNDWAMSDLEHVKTFDREFDRKVFIRTVDRKFMAEILTPELRRTILDDPRFERWSVAVESGYIRTWAKGELTQDDLFAEADFLIDVEALLPQEFWDRGDIGSEGAKGTDASADG
jgi:hypothetical protein